MQNPFTGQARFGSGLRGYGMAVRTAQSLGIEWLDHARQSRDDFLATAGRVAQAPSPVAAASIQLDYLRRSTERFTTHATVCGGLLAALAEDMGRQGLSQGFGQGFAQPFGQAFTQPFGTAWTTPWAGADALRRAFTPARAS